MGSDVWLRSAEANINLGGSVAVTFGHRGEEDRTLDQLALEGELTTNRGTYRLNLGGIVQSTFTVESGTVRFYGDPDFNPTLDIDALHTFFFQAEDGIRDLTVTGVQTCALPI